MKLRDTVLSHEVNGEMVFLDVASGDFFTLDQVGAMMWKGISGGGTPEEVVEGLKTEFDVDTARLMNDLNDLLVTMEDNGLIVGE